MKNIKMLSNYICLFNHFIKDLENNNIIYCIEKDNHYDKTDYLVPLNNLCINFLNIITGYSNKSINQYISLYKFRYLISNTKKDLYFKITVRNDSIYFELGDIFYDLFFSIIISEDLEDPVIYIDDIATSSNYNIYSAYDDLLKKINDCIHDDASSVKGLLNLLNMDDDLFINNIFSKYGYQDFYINKNLNIYHEYINNKINNQIKFPVKIFKEYLFNNFPNHIASIIMHIFSISNFNFYLKYNKYKDTVSVDFLEFDKLHKYNSFIMTFHFNEFYLTLDFDGNFYLLTAHEKLSVSGLEAAYNHILFDTNNFISNQTDIPLTDITYKDFCICQIIRY